MAEKVYGDRVKLEVNCFDAAVNRVTKAYDMCDEVAIAFSGGKDSTAVLNVALAAAEKLDRLPLKVVFFDEEAIPMETEDYVRRVAQDPRIDLTWSCIPIKHRNACSKHSPYWLTWDPDKKDLWCRPMPPEAVTHEDMPQVPWMTLVDQIGYFLPASMGTVIQMLGRRTQESLTRWKMIAQRGGTDAWITTHHTPLPPEDGKRYGPHHGDKETKGSAWHHMKTADPIYDWATEDVWLAALKNDWDYNKAYDKMAAAGLSPFRQRIAPPYGEEPASNLWMFQTCWPELWDKMSMRVPGANTAAKYYKSKLYNMTGSAHHAPNEGETWQEYVTRLIMQWPPDVRSKVARNISILVGKHNAMCRLHLKRIDAIPDTEPHPNTGMSWRLLAKVASKGVLKRRTLLMALNAKQDRNVAEEIIDDD